MKFSKIINYPLGLLGLKMIRKPADISSPVKDIEEDKGFQHIYQQVKECTMAGMERCYALYESVQYIIKANIKGDFVECGVWKGGSAMLIAFTLHELGVSNRKIILYDTYEGMTSPGEHDGEAEKNEWEKNKINEEQNSWCLATIEEVKANMLRTNYPIEQISLVKGKVEDTIPAQSPAAIALLRLDTDWYDSTRHELVHLYPLLEKGGILIIDDYGTWKGAKKATDEYFGAMKHVFLHRIDHTGRLLIRE